VTTGFAEFNYIALPESDGGKEEQLLEKYATHSTDTSTLLSDGAKAAPPEDLAPATADTKDNESKSTLTQPEIKSIEKCKRTQARAKGKAKGSTACFVFNTRILVIKAEKASWIPICRTKRDDMAVQSLPSGDITNLTGATTTAIKTVCTFECPASGIDLVQLGQARITAHHHIQIPEGWMTARQAAEMGHGTLLANRFFSVVFSLCLEGGGNIIIDTTADMT